MGIFSDRKEFLASFLLISLSALSFSQLRMILGNIVQRPEYYTVLFWREFFSLLFFLSGIYAVLKNFMNSRFAFIGTFISIWALCFVFLIRHSFYAYSPYEIITLAVLTWGYWLSLKDSKKIVLRIYLIILCFILLYWMHSHELLNFENLKNKLLWMIFRGKLIPMTLLILSLWEITKVTPDCPQLQRVWRQSGVTFVLAMGYAYLRLKYNGESPQASWQDLVDMKAQRPFVARLLIPQLCHYWQFFFGGKASTLFLVAESISTFALLKGIRYTLRSFVSEKIAHIAPICFLWGLTIPFVYGHIWNVYFPSDTASMAFVVWGMGFALREKRIPLYILTFFAALNRETAILIPILASTFDIQKYSFKKTLHYFLPSLMICVLIKIVLIYETQNLQGSNLTFVIRFLYSEEKIPRILNNYLWFISDLNGLQTPLFFLSLPFAYLALSKFIASQLRYIILPLLMMFVALMFVANIYEPRILGELLVAMYIPVVSGANIWASTKPHKVKFHV